MEATVTPPGRPNRVTIRCHDKDGRETLMFVESTHDGQVGLLSFGGQSVFLDPGSTLRLLAATAMHAAWANPLWNKYKRHRAR
ncbi:hypothetical protein [Actinokineospora sp.]|uniref:hypothetical protein n=1 Tax=Actinokineospora sp. TaxID=1872133 RepID=UPI0040380111